MHMTLGSTPHWARHDEQELIFLIVKQGLTMEAQARLHLMITVSPVPLYPAKEVIFDSHKGKHDGVLFKIKNESLGLERWLSH